MGIFGDKSAKSFSRTDQSGNNLLDKASALVESDRASRDGFKPINSHAYFSVDDVAGLIRELPRQHTETLATLVSKTLALADTDLNDLIAEAEQRETELQEKLSALALDLEQLQNQLQAYRQEVDLLGSQRAEVAKVKNDFIRAQTTALPPQ